MKKIFFSGCCIGYFDSKHDGCRNKCGLKNECKIITKYHKNESDAVIKKDMRVVRGIVRRYAHK